MELRKIVGAPVKDLADCIGWEGRHPEMQTYIRKYDSQISSSPVYHDYEILSVMTEEEEAEMQRLANLGFQAVLRPWGKLHQQMEEEWTQLCAETYEKKEYLEHGIYAKARERESREYYSDLGFTWPLPIEDGQTLLETEKEFALPFDIHEYLDAIGGEEWLTNRGSGILVLM
jgi:hypothetical protein